MFQKSKFDEYKEKYKLKLLSDPNPKVALWFEALENFQSHWDLEALDFKSMFDRSFKSQISTSLWKGDDNHPKEVMLDFIDYDKEIVRSILRDLLDERREIGGRMERFVFYCDQLLKEIQNKGSKFYGHYHGDYFMVSLYLTFCMPEKYTFYKYDIFRKSMEAMGAKSPPLTNDMERYFKIVKVLNKMLLDDSDLDAAFTAQSENYSLPAEKTLLLVYDFLLFVANN